jgi:hypothetical protein
MIIIIKKKIKQNSTKKKDPRAPFHLFEKKNLQIEFHIFIFIPKNKLNYRVVQIIIIFN